MNRKGQRDKAPEGVSIDSFRDLSAHSPRQYKLLWSQRPYFQVEQGISQLLADLAKLTSLSAAYMTQKTELSADDRIRYPILLLLDSENIHTTLKGWRTDKGFLLHESIETVLHFTPDLAV